MTAPGRFGTLALVLTVLAVTLPALGCRKPTARSAGGPYEGERVHMPSADAQAPTGGVNDPRWHDAPYVVMVSLDGFSASYMARYRPPHLTGLARAGVWASQGMISSYPSKTFPNHYTLATGLYPARHGIVANSFWDPAREALYAMGDRAAVEDGTWYGGEPLWVTAERQGMVAASFFWVGSEADVRGVRPSHWRRYDGSVPNEERVDQVLTWLALPTERRPHLITLYFSDADDAGHRHGPDSPQLAAAVQRLDRMVGRLRTGLEALPAGDRTHLIVVSDHGMDSYGTTDYRYIEDVTPVEGLRMPERGPSANLWVAGGPARVLEVREAINRELDGVTAYLADQVPERLRYRDHARLGDLVLVNDSAVMVELARDPERPARAGYTHGWDPHLLSMRALFLASGPGLVAGREVRPFENVHVAPLIASLLGLTPPDDIDGDAGHWRGVLRRR